MTFSTRIVLTTLALLTATPILSAAPKAGQDRVAQLEAMVRILQVDLASVRKEQEVETKKREEIRSTMVAMMKDVQTVKDNWLDLNSGFEKLRFGGYGEIHANFTNSGGSDMMDIHRLVFYVGYDFADWIHLNSEIEIEHAYVTDGAGGEISIEQLYLDFDLHKNFNLRAGRMLAPLGITNENHEPPLTWGVERTMFDKYIIPSTWSVDGIGAWGEICESLTYKAYLVGGLDGSKFDASNGIRKGRIKERGSFQDVAITGRLDYTPIDTPDEFLRLGVSGYCGGIDNANKGKENGLGGKLKILSGDFSYRNRRFEARGAFAYETISNAKAIGNNTAEAIFGWYVEAGYHVVRPGELTGKLADSDILCFVRYEHVDTQHKMPSGVAANKSAQRTCWTLGVNFYPTKSKQIVIKADYQILDDKSTTKPDNKLNLGVGWSF
ncbi:MAG: hypothetical protein HN909_08500 [Phycisphaerales bacterium]|jgi:hypothetical protein|nr:hypothetical protein [Phycisphaerales bacterium]MBT7171794.1 hypothetical protein [Phycisphaerales bacterium]